MVIVVFPEPSEKFGWREQLHTDVRSIRVEVRRKGGVKAKIIDEAVEKYRKKKNAPQDSVINTYWGTQICADKRRCEKFETDYW